MEMMVSLLMYSCEIANQQVYGIMGTFKIDNQMSFGGLCMQGCNGTHFCPIEMFKKHVVAPHLKRSFESLCTVAVEHQPPERQSWFHRLFVPFYLFRWPGKPAHAQSICQSELEL
jgi:hypothetical protein